MGATGEDPRQQLKAAIAGDDRSAIDALLTAHAELRTSLDEPLFEWSKPALAAARTVETAKLILSHGARAEKVGVWWARGISVRSVDPEVGRFLAQSGATLTPHAAAALGLVDELTAMLDADPAMIDAKGADDCTPLHFARDVPTAKLLVDRGARVDARDTDHDSTPAQWLIGDSPEVVRYLYEQGATPDVFVASALGDRELVEQLVAEDRSILALRVGKPPLPAIGYENLGGTVLQWTLGFNSFAHQYAAAKGHDELFRHLFHESDVTTRFLVACVMAMRDEAQELIGTHPDLVASLNAEDLELLARYCWETNADVEAVRLMLDVGFPVDHPETRHGFSPLHNAAWGGYGDLVDLLIERGHPVDLRDPDFGSLPLAWAIHCCVAEGRHPEGEYGRVVESLLEAGHPWDVTIYPTGDARIDEVLEPRLWRRLDGLARLGERDAVEAELARKPEPEALVQALTGAARGGHVELCERLVEAGAPVAGSAGPSRLTPLHGAVSGKSSDIVELFLSRGADATARSFSDSTPLHFAAAAGCGPEVWRLLLARDVSEGINVRNRFGNTAVDLAVESGHGEVVEILRRAGGLAAEDLEKGPR